MDVSTDLIEQGEALKQAIDDEKKAAAKEANEEAAAAKREAKAGVATLHRSLR